MRAGTLPICLSVLRSVWWCGFKTNKTEDKHKVRWALGRLTQEQFFILFQMIKKNYLRVKVFRWMPLLIPARGRAAGHRCSAVSAPSASDSCADSQRCELDSSTASDPHLAHYQTNSALRIVSSPYSFATIPPKWTHCVADVTEWCIPRKKWIVLTR